MKPTEFKAEQFPSVPGVYVMKDAKGEILYVGKAKSLRSRVGSYFSALKDGRYQVEFLMRKVAEIEPIVTSNEKEALLLENTLIKKHRPRYNIFLKDDKSYLSLKLNVGHPFPRLLPTRRIEKDGSLYFGPYTSAFRARETADFVERYFHLRNCSEHEFANRVRPCLQFQIKRCDAPCVNLISPEAYGEIVEQVKLFLKGRREELSRQVKEKMEKASEEMNFEEAARQRDLLNAIQRTLEKQKVASHFGGDEDAIGLFREAERVSLSVLISRGGLLSERKNYFFTTPQESEEILENFLLQYYRGAEVIPPCIYLPLKIEGQAQLQEILSEIKGQKVQLLLPQKGEKLARVKLAEANAKERLKREVLTQEGREELLNRVQERFGLSRLPRRIECYDISNIQGTLAVGSCVSFLDGLPDKSAYRRFKIKTVAGANDFAMLYEVLSRRFQRTDWERPDLIIIDGGKGQLNAAGAALNDLNVLGIDLISLAKEKPDFYQNEKKKEKGGLPKKPERIFLPGRKNPVVLPPHSSELHLIMRLRDEAHRFGITFHRKLRNRSGLQSRLDSIPGVGFTRKQRLLRHFGSLKRLGGASLEEIQQVKGMNQKVAQLIFESLKEPAVDSQA